ncbi:MAG: phosphatase PAP2 family protein, partial [Oscillospiraceae bacterium]|nr:phosphatase PAP2 family protein [Oscillospiraceae bacterium]
ACVYRPWIRDARIVPYGDSITTATGYSFPSGHTMNASTVYGGGVVRKDLPRVLRFMLGLLILLVAFSRIYLGVHTPQDILVGIVAGILVMCLTVKLMQWVKNHPEKDLPVAGIGIGLAALVAIYAAVKPYPVDRDAAGKVLVEGAKMANDTFRGVGWCIAFLTGWILERRFGQFSTDISMIKRITRITAGLLGYYVVSLIFVPVIREYIAGAPGSFISSYLQMFYVSFIFPWIIKRFERT